MLICVVKQILGYSPENKSEKVPIFSPLENDCQLTMFATLFTTN
jgi:hypothetical protein